LRNYNEIAVLAIGNARDRLGDFSDKGTRFVDDARSVEPLACVRQGMFCLFHVRISEQVSRWSALLPLGWPWTNTEQDDLELLLVDRQIDQVLNRCAPLWRSINDKQHFQHVDPSRKSFA
jgi:hypothetical protein